MEEWLVVVIALVAVGLIAGVLAGMFGIGGGIVTVPALEATLSFLGIDPAIRMHIAVATSLAIIIPTSMTSAYAHHRRGSVDLEIVRRWAAFLIAGALIGAWIASMVHGRMLAFIFASLALATAIKLMLFPESRNLTQSLPRGAWVPIIPAAIGNFSSMMGVGGGTFSVIALTLFNYPIHRAVGTAALFGLIIAVPGSVGFVLAGLNDIRVPTGSFGYVSLIGFLLIAPSTVIAAPIGVRIAHEFSERKLSILFGVISVVASVRLFYKAME
ncbi:MAG: sulfite exporter TauE/SafE family protein [Haliea sp.]